MNYDADPKVVAAKAAILAVLNRIKAEPRLAYFISPATETYAKLTAAIAALSDVDVAKFRAEFEQGLTFSALAPEEDASLTFLERLGAAIEKALDNAPVADVLAILTGALVGLSVELCRCQGHDVNQPITLKGGPNRDITISAPKAPSDIEANGAAAALL